MVEPKPLDLDEIEKEVRKKAYDREFGKSVSDVVPVVHPVVDLEDIIRMLKEIKQRIKSACEFYLRYKDNPDLLIKEQNWVLELEYEGNIIGNMFDYAYGCWEGIWDNIGRYKEWLFKLAFGSMM